MKGRRFAVWTNLVLSAVMALVVWVLLVWVAARPALRTLIDLTPQQVNSVDATTVELLRELRSQQAEIEFHLFYPPVVGQGGTSGQDQDLAIRSRLRELTRLLLVRYQYLGGDGLEVIEHDFYGDATGTREAAQRFDYKNAEQDLLVVAVRLPGKEWRFKKKSLWFDLGRVEVSMRSPNGGPVPNQAPSVLKAYKGEEVISSALKSLLVEGTPVAYVLSGYAGDFSDNDQVPTGYGQFLRSLQRNGFELRPLKLDGKPVPADAAVVLVLEPRSEFLPTDADALFAYVKRGGRLLLNYSWASLPDWNPTGGRLGELLGYELSVAPVFHKIPDGGLAGGKGLDGDAAVARLQLGVNANHPALRRLAESRRALELVDARAVRERDGAPPAVRREPLLWTGDKGWLAVPDQNGQPDFRAPNLRLGSYFVGMSCEVDADAGRTPAPGAPRTGQVVILTGLVCNNGMMPFAGDLAVNLVSWMAARSVLLNLQDTGYEAKYLNVQLPNVLRVFHVLVYGVPGLFLLAGAFVLWRRRRI